ncbi:MAG: tRNA (guanosine(46)-N7)-methyltransferase TrmB [Phycisphaerales bacterium]|nr:tRNA (guanosine(46)-N7)-methyltransferase TrmB [Phycisphaerales bacterium]
MSFGLSRGRTLDVSGFGLGRDDLPDESAGPVDPRRWFDCPDRPFELEIGSGKGTFLVQQCGLQPDTNFLGIEWTGEFYRYGADRLRRNGCTNARMLHENAVEFIGHRVPDGVCDVIHLYFSDPWPKSRHHKRRVVQDATLKQFHRVLKPSGLVHIVTDHPDLWTWTQEHVLRATALFERLPFTPPPSARDGEVIGTNFERKYRREGRPFHAMTLRRI